MKKYTIAFHVSLWSAAVIAFAMGVYAVFQYYTMPEMTVQRLLVEHMSHVVLLGLLIYLVMIFVLNRLVVRPLCLICWYFFEAGRGEGHRVPVKTPVKELADIFAWGSTVRRMQAYHASGRLGQISERASGIRQAIGSVADGNLDDVARLSRLAGELQQEVAQLELLLSGESSLSAE